MRGYYCENCQDAGCDYCKPKKQFQPNNVIRITCENLRVIMEDDYDALLKAFIAAETRIAELEAQLSAKAPLMVGPLGRIMCRDHEWLDEKPCPYCADLKTQSEAPVPYASDEEPSAPAEDVCEGGEPCWRNPETGYIEYCPKHDGMMADRIPEADARQPLYPEGKMNDEYVSVYETLGAKIDKQEDEIARLVSRTLQAEARLNLSEITNFNLGVDACMKLLQEFNLQPNYIQTAGFFAAKLGSIKRLYPATPAPEESK